MSACLCLMQWVVRLELKRDHGMKKKIVCSNNMWRNMEKEIGSISLLNQATSSFSISIYFLFCNLCYCCFSLCFIKHMDWFVIMAGLNRCRKSCRLRWLNYLRPNIRRGYFEYDEDDLIIRLHKLLGNRQVI